MGDQRSFLEMSMEEILQKNLDKPKKRFCKHHRYANKDTDFIEVVIKTTGDKVLRCLYCERDKLDNKRFRQKEWQSEKENVSDYYVTRVLKAGKTGIKGDIPNQLIQAKRAVIKLKNLTEKLDEPLKTCSAHGKLFQNDVIKAGIEKSGHQRWRCKKCMKEMHERHYLLNKAKVLAKQAVYKKENGDQLKKTKAKHWQKYKDNYKVKKLAHRQQNPEKYKQYDRKRVENLNDNYVKKILTSRTGIKREDIPDSLVQAKRAIIQLTRGVKKIRDQNILLKLEEQFDVKKDR